MEETIKVQSEYLRKTAETLSRECQEGMKNYQEASHQLMALTSAFWVKGMEQIRGVTSKELEEAQQSFQETKELSARLLQMAEQYEQAERGNVDAAVD